MTCSSSAASYYEENPFYRIEEHVVRLLVLWFIKYMLIIGFMRKLFLAKFTPKGVFEYLIAHTSFLSN